MEAYVETPHKTGSRTITLSSYTTLGSTDITTPKKRTILDMYQYVSE